MNVLACDKTDQVTRMKKLTAQAHEEAGQREDQMELNQREKDEGDLFGVRAIEAGFYAGIPQSRPTSRAGSPSMSSTTLLGGYNSPKIQTNSMASSVTDLPLAHTNKRHSSTLLSTSPPPKRTSSALRLEPSEAEVAGRHNHNVDVNMNLNVPPSPVLTKAPRSPTFGGSDEEKDAAPRHYAPTAPQLPMPQGLQDSLMVTDHVTKSHAASLSYTDVSPENSAPPSPGLPSAKKPTMPSEGSNSPYVAYNPGRQSMPPVHPVLILPTTTYEPTHKRDQSGASSVYSEKRSSTYQHEGPNPTGSNRNSVALGATSTETKRQSSANSSLLTPGSTNGKDYNDPRFSEFYDAYYRNSQLIKDGPKRPEHIHTEATIAEVPTPLSSPAPPGHQPGVAM
ncbi:hypothetical protein P280DRAFT_235008 [Massarina eburnea CBS 473.64]|uniref:Uncharacterized protein n=1 Tax=Massarina eburnea CBS 473.64 TaxID=1395130 RepID=A0A6A6RHZ8_9PLEO|nr:hypothetical protein P280DRAFT_235008 [Massarina eburnea CBS 473.64]